MKLKLKRVNQDDLIRLPADNARVHVRTRVEPIPLSREQQKQKLQEQMARSQGTLTNLGGKPSTDTRTPAQRNADYLHPIKGIIARQKSEWDNGAHLVQGLTKTVGASALIAAGLGYSSPAVTTFSGLGQNVIAGALGTEGSTMLGGKLATPKEIAIGATFEAGLPMAMKGTSQLYGKIFNKTTTPIVKNVVQEVAPTLHLKSTMTGSPLEKQLSKDGMLSINSLQAHINNQSTSVADKTMIQKVLDEKFAGQRKINYNDFRKAISDEMVPLEKNFDSNYSDYGISNIGYQTSKTKPIINLDDEIRRYTEMANNPTYNETTRNDYRIHLNNLKKRKENELLIPKENTSIIYSNKNKFGRGSTDHFKNEGTLGHSRILVSNEEPDVMHVLEQQSDYYQRDPKQQVIKKLKEYENNYNNLMSDPIYKNMPGLEKSLNQTIANQKSLVLEFIDSPNKIQKELLGKTHQERLLQENVVHAAQNGQTKMRYPTPETAAKIQGYTKLAARNPNDDYLPEHKTILKKYAENPKMIKKVLGQDTRTVTDAKGNSWYEFDIPESFRKGKAEIKALSTVGAVATVKGIIDKKTKYAYGGNIKKRYAFGYLNIMSK